MLGKSIKSGLATLCALFVVSVFAGCRGDISRKPPVHLNRIWIRRTNLRRIAKAHSSLMDARCVTAAGHRRPGKLKADTKLHCGKANSNDCASKEDVAFIERCQSS